MEEVSIAELGLRTVGRAKQPIEVERGRELLPEDIAKLNLEKGSTPAPITKLRDRHHSLARLLAEGVPSGKAAFISGYTPSRVSILASDPTFKELVSYYASKLEEDYRDLHTMLAAISKDAAEELLDRIEDAPEDFSVGQLMELVKTGADRTGHGPSSTKSIDIRSDIADRLEFARARASAGVSAKLIEG